jgi:hypothetical protein
MNPLSGMSSPHKPTLITVLIVLVIAFVIYHLMFGRHR